MDLYRLRYNCLGNMEIKSNTIYDKEARGRDIARGFQHSHWEDKLSSHNLPKSIQIEL